MVIIEVNWGKEGRVIFVTHLRRGKLKING
jgi:hypothetical protein